ncbi:MAG TPA: hypothetical protein PLY23_09320 [Alphaproteobacteria bacterium]|nr:hypothetical protein [Alphaproteobacteria bacterium]HQS94790.1 hypothetical protein [Alphaproteobacteria bacterium]
MKVTLFRTKVYERSLTRLPQESDISQIEEKIAQDPMYWPVIPGTGGIRKARFGIGSKGSRGGGRLCYFYLMSESHLYLLKAYAKNVQTDLTASEKKDLQQLVKQIKEIRS